MCVCVRVPRVVGPSWTYGTDARPIRGVLAHFGPKNPLNDGFALRATPSLSLSYLREEEKRESQGLINEFEMRRRMM